MTGGTGFRPIAQAGMMRERARLLSFIREWMATAGVLEVETPILSGRGNSDPGIRQFRSGRSDELWLRTSPEHPMKRLLAADISDIYEMGRVFRYGESGRLHNPEFTLLEWYRREWSYEQLMAETAELVRACGEAWNRSWPVREHRYGNLFSGATGIDPHRADLEDLRAAAQRLEVALGELERWDRNGLLDLLVTHAVEPTLERGAIHLIRDYPASQAALARVRKADAAGDPPVAERFEVYIGQIELANGYQELTDPVEQERRFRAENRRRRQTGEMIVNLDERLLEALRAGLPDCTGVALGVDRLLMALTGAEHIDEVLAFPADRA
jgi:lysyl-tRNA synthetase class 2